MDPDRYCLNEAAPPGSSLYYATLFAGTRERAALVAIHALRHTLLGIVDTIADPNVRAHKLNWWSDEIMEARDGGARHPVSVAITRHGGRRFWRRPEVLAMLSAVARVSAANGLASNAARDCFCEDVGGGTAQLCAAVVAFAPGDGALDDIRVLGSALERAMLAGTPSVRSGLKRIPDSTPDSLERIDHGDSGGGLLWQSTEEHAGDDPGAAARNANECIDSDSGTVARRIAEERTRAHQALVGAVSGLPRHTGPAALVVYRALALIQLAALANALRKPARSAPRAVSITPIRKLWIAWRTARRDR